MPPRATAIRVTRACRPPARGTAGLALVVALLRLPAFAFVISLVAASTDAERDGPSRLLPGEPLLVIGFLELLATFVLAAATTTALRSAAHN